MSEAQAPTRGLTIHGAPEGFDALLLARRRAETDAPIIHVCRDDARTARMIEALGFFAPDVEVLRFPAWDCLPYDRVSPNPEIVAERVSTLTRLLEPGTRPRIVVTTVNALVQKVPPRAVFQDATLLLKKGGRVKPEVLTAFLEANGYGRSGTVMEPGEYAVRGGIIDLFPSGEPDPIRLDMFGDEIESIRRFDTGSQRSGAALAQLWLRPVGEVFLDEASIARFRAGYRDLFGAAAASDPLYASISAGRKHPGMEHWAGLFHESMETLLDYLPGASVSLDHQAEDVLAARLEMIADHYEARRAPVRTQEGEVPYRPGAARDPVPRPGAAGTRCWRAGRCSGFSPFARVEEAEGVEAGGRPGRLFTEARTAGQNVFAAYAEHADGHGRRPGAGRWSPPGPAARASGWATCCGRIGSRPSRSTTSARSAGWARAWSALAVLGLERGFVAPASATGAKFGLSVVGEQDLLGERIARPPRRRKRADQFIADATGIEQGDLVVHQDHGIGRYDGLVHHRGEWRAARLPAAALRRRRQAVPAGREHRGAVALRHRDGGHRPRQARRHLLAVAQGAGQAAHPGHGRAAHPHRRRAAGEARGCWRRRRRGPGTSSAPASPSPRPRTSSAPSPMSSRTWPPAGRWTG